MLKWAGHDAVAVLDGGLQTWTALGGATSQGTEPAHFQSNFALHESLRQLVSADEVEQSLAQAGHQTLIDARAPARYRGEVEPMDPVAGHIPGALNRPFTDNIALDGRFKPKELLRAEFEALLQDRDPATRGAPMRQRRQRPAQLDRHGDCRVCTYQTVCRQLERMVRQPGAPGRQKLTTSFR